MKEKDRKDEVTKVNEEEISSEEEVIGRRRMRTGRKGYGECNYEEDGEEEGREAVRKS